MEERHWEDATGTKSYFEGLTFQANRKWTSGIITFVGTRKKQKISFKVTAGSRTILEDDFNLEEGEVKRYNFYVNGNVGVNVSGYVERAALFHGAGARVDVALYYDNTKENLLTVSRTWRDETGDISCIENLNLGSEHYWRKVQVVLSGKKDASTGAMITVLANGEIVSMLPWKDIKGTDTASFDVEINNRVPIIVAGYITNKDVFFSGGLEVKLIGFYKEGE